MHSQTNTEVQSRQAVPAVVSDAAGLKPFWKVERMLLCTDFSSNSKDATEAAIQIWKSVQAKVTLVHVCEQRRQPVRTEEDLIDAQLLYSDRTLKLARIVADLKGRGVDVDTQLLTGNPPTTILELIEQQKPDLAILGTRATRGVGRFVFGSTAEAVFRQAKCPVMTVGIACERLATSVLSGPIVTATDFHDGAEEAVRFAMAVANTLHVELHCLHVLPAGSNSESNIVESIMLEALQQLTIEAGSCERPPVHRVLFDSEVSHAISDYARKNRASAIVLGVRRKTRIASHLPAQRAYRLITTAPCPVITTPCKRDSVFDFAAASL
jgi:nucleotide-binding universal stress UspA family protein